MENSDLILGSADHSRLPLLPVPGFQASRGKFSTAQGQPIHLATLKIEDLGAPHQFSEYTADPSNLNPVPNDIGHNHLVSVGLVLISNTLNT